MSAWNDYSTGERIKLLRGAMTQQELAEAAGVSIALVQKAEQDQGSLTLASLMKLSGALDADLSVVIGEQAPRRAITRNERATLRAVALATHEAGAFLVSDIEPGEPDELRRLFDQVFSEYWNGVHTNIGAILPGVLREAAALYQGSAGLAREVAGALLGDAFQLAAHYANNTSSRDLAYAATGYARGPVAAASDELRAARLEALVSWVYMRDGRMRQAMELAERTALSIEPRYSQHDQRRIAIYGNLVTNAAIAASRGGGSAEQARDYMSQVHAAAARMTLDIVPHGAIFGPVAAITQGISVAISLGDIGHALELIDGGRLNLNAPGVLDASKSRYLLDVAWVRCEQGRWDDATQSLMSAHRYAPQYTRIQGITAAVVRRITEASATNMRRLASTIGVPYVAA
jgi:transcriptional regulator with XRE-family HTH domain